MYTYRHEPMQLYINQYMDLHSYNACVRRRISSHTFMTADNYSYSYESIHVECCIVAIY